MGRRHRLLTTSAAVFAATALAVTGCSDDSGDEAPSKTTVDTIEPTSTVAPDGAADDGATSSGGGDGAVEQDDVAGCRQRLIDLIEATGDGATLSDQAQVFADFDAAGCNELCGDVQDPESPCRPEE